MRTVKEKMLWPKRRLSSRHRQYAVQHGAPSTDDRRLLWLSSDSQVTIVAVNGALQSPRLSRTNGGLPVSGHSI